MQRILQTFFTLILTFGLIACSSNNTGGSGGNKDETVTIRYSNVYNEDTSYGKSVKKIKELVEERSNGEIEMELFHGAELGSERDVIEGLHSGSIEMMQTGTAGIGLYVPESALIELWFNFDNVDQLVDSFSTIKEEFDVMYQENNFKLLGAFYTGPRTILSNRRIENLDELNNLKIRVPDATLYVQMAEALGTSPINMPLGDVYTGLQTGAIDALEGDPDSLYQQKFYEQAEYLIMDEHVYNPLSIIINNEFWQGLSDEHKEIVAQAVEDGSQYHLELMNEANETAIQEMKELGTEVVEVKDLDKWKEKIVEEKAEFANQYGEFGEKVLKVLDDTK